MQWIMIAIQIVNMFWPRIKDCITVERVRRYGLNAQLIVYRAAIKEGRKNGLYGVDLRKSAIEVVKLIGEEIADSTDDELQMAIDQMAGYADDMESEPGE